MPIVPKRYGLRQTIGDTLGVGGIMRGLRTIPVLLDIARDMERLCPGALLLQYVNHMAFYLRLRHDGRDLYPRLRTVLDEGRVPAGNRVRYELYRHFGYFVTESSEHLAEYVPWFIKRDRPDLLERLAVPLDEYLRRCQEQIRDWQAMRERLEHDDVPLDVTRSHEYAATIIHAIETGTPSVVYGNVENDGLLDDLPAGCCVEVPCLVDENGVQPTRIGVLPPQLAALMRTNVNVQQLTVEAALTRRREHVYHAAMLDPHTAAELDLDQIHDLVDDLLAAHGTWIPEMA